MQYKINLRSHPSGELGGTWPMCLNHMKTQQIPASLTLEKRKGTATRREDSLSDNIIAQHDAKYILCVMFVLFNMFACPECIRLQEASKELCFSKDCFFGKVKNIDTINYQLFLHVIEDFFNKARRKQMYPLTSVWPIQRNHWQAWRNRCVNWTSSDYDTPVQVLYEKTSFAYIKWWYLLCYSWMVEPICSPINVTIHSYIAVGV